MFSLDVMKAEILEVIKEVNPETVVTEADITVDFTRNVFEVTIANLDVETKTFFVRGSDVIGRYVVRTIGFIAPTEEGFITFFRG